jgi:DNA-binding transcriptional LysR family regulator
VSLGRLGVSAADLQVAAELGSTEAIKEAVVQGLGLAVLSRRAVQKDVRAGTLRALHVDGLTLDRDISIVRDRRRALPPAASAFLAFVRPAPEPGPKAAGTP